VLPLAHIGIGTTLVRPWRKQVALRAVLLGTLLPDLIDKPLYYIPHFVTGLSGGELGFISGTRTLGHSLIFLVLLFFLAAFHSARHRNWWLGLALGVATHLFLDNFLEPFFPLTEHSSRIALFFPLYGWQFPTALHHGIAEHLMMHFYPLDLGAEILGAGLIAWLWVKRATWIF
jgi:membrane-bound metal-dependent hydrolase YbcI (DUF457 family)